MEKMKLNIQQFAYTPPLSEEIGICYCNGSSSEYGVYKAWLNLNSVTRVYGNPSGTISGQATGPTTGSISVSVTSNGAQNSINITTRQASYTYNSNTVSGNGNLFLQKKYSGGSKYTTNGLYCQVTVWSANSGGDQFNSGKIRCNKAGSSSADDYVKTPGWSTINNIPTGDSTIGIWVDVAADNSSGTRLRGVSKTFDDINIQNNNASINTTIYYKKQTDSTWTSVSGTSASLTNLTPATVYQYYATLTNAGDSSKTTTLATGTFTTTPATPKFNTNPTLSPATSESQLNWSSFTSDINCTSSIALYQGNTLISTRTISSTGTTSHASGSFTGLSANTQYRAIVTITNSTYTAYYATKEISATTYDYPKITSHTSTSSNSLNVQNSNTVYLTIYNPLNRQCQVAAFTTDSGGSVIVGDSSATTHANNSTVTLAFDGTKVGQALGSSGKSMTIYYRCVYGNSNKNYNTGTLSITETFAKPSLNDTKKTNYFYFWDSNSTTVGYTGSNQILLGNQSVPKYKLKGASYFPFTAQYSASIARVEVTCTTSGVSNFTTTTLTSGFTSDSSDIYVFNNNSNKAINDRTSIAIKIKATDTRGYTNEYSTSIAITQTNNPIINLTKAQRQGGYGETIEFTYSGQTVPDLSSGTGLYDFTNWKLQYKVTGASSWSEDAVTFTSKSATDKVASGAYSTQNSYVMRIKAQDKFGNYSYSSEFPIPEGEPTMFIDTLKNGVGVNCFPNGEGLWLKSGTNTISLDKKILNVIYPIGSIFMSISSNFDTKTKVQNYFGGTWEKIEGKFLIGASSSYTINSTGGSDTITSVPPHTHSMNFTSGGSTPGTNTVADHSHTVNNHTHTQSGTFNTNDVGNHHHSYGFGSPYRASDGSKWWTAGNSTTGGGSAQNTTDAGGHKHTVTISGETGGSTPGTTGAGGHSHTVNNHTHSVNGSTSNSGTNISSGGVSIIPPYYAVYIWRRTG